MTQKEPAAGEDPLQLLLINIGFDEDTAANQSAIGIDEAGDAVPI
jgi:hypothetical protein